MEEYTTNRKEQKLHEEQLKKAARPVQQLDKETSPDPQKKVDIPESTKIQEPADQDTQATYNEAISTTTPPLTDTKPPKALIPPTPKKNPIEVQREKEKKQKKFDEIRMSALTNKERGKIEDYEKKLIEWLMLEPENKEFTERLSDHYFTNQQYLKAMSLLKKLVNNDPNHHKAIRQIGQIYIHQNDLDTAKILIEKAISEKSDNPKYHISLVDIHYAKNNLTEAIRSMEKVLKLRPKNKNYLLSIATLHEENAEPSKALYYYGKVIELDPLNDQAKLGISRLS